MTRETNLVVRWKEKDHHHADSIARGRWLATRGQLHLHWPAPPDDGEAEGMLLAEIDGAVVGRVHVEGIYPPFGELQNMNVARPWRGRGAGGALVDKCIRHLGQRGFMAVFAQTHFQNPPAHRLYARKGFIPVARGEMLRLLRFISFPLLEEFLHDRPLAIYCPPDERGGRRWPLTWADWATEDRLTITLTGGSSDKDSGDVGPGISHVEIRSQALSFTACLAGPDKANVGEAIRLRLQLANQAEEPLAASVRLLLPPGVQSRGQWARRGPAEKLEPGREFEAAFDVLISSDTEMIDPQGVTFTSLPLTVEVFVGGTSFWLSRGVIVSERSPGESQEGP